MDSFFNVLSYFTPQRGEVSLYLESGHAGVGKRISQCACLYGETKVNAAVFAIRDTAVNLYCGMQLTLRIPRYHFQVQVLGDYRKSPTVACGCGVHIIK